MVKKDGPWVGVDLDGTLAFYDGWRGPQYIGDPIPLMLERVKKWLEAGMRIKIFTARACVPEDIPHIQKWCKEHVGHELEITCMKDFEMLELYDDRAYRVEKNTGVILE